MDRDILISVKTVIFTLILVLGLYLVYLLGPILIILIVSTIIVISLEHMVQFIISQTFMNRPVSRSVAVIVTYVVVIMTVAGIFTIVLPPVVIQGQKLISNLSKTIPELSIFQNFGLGPATGTLPSIADVSEGVVSTTFSIFSRVAWVFSVLIISIYMSLDWENIKKRIFSLFNGRLREEIEDTFKEIEVSIGHWIKGQLALMLVIGIMSFVGLVILRVDYPLALSIVAGLLEIVPVLGPVIALLLAGIVGFSDSVTKGLAVVGLFTLIQQLENNLLVPKVMHKVSGFSPLVILLALLVGGRLLGLIGAVIAVPTMMMLVIIVKRIIRYSS